MNQADRIAQLQALASNLPTYFPSTNLYVAGERYDTAQAQALVTQMVDAMTALAEAKTRVKDAQLALEKTQAQVGNFIKDLRVLVGAGYSTKPSVLADLGVAPRKARTPLSAEARITAEAKARATRAARKTMGKKQRAAIRGAVTGVTITPILTSDPAPSATTSTAPTPAATSTQTAMVPAVAAPAHTDGTAQTLVAREAKAHAGDVPPDARMGAGAAV
jgi:septal ring-binding cell division protein DamX